MNLFFTDNEVALLKSEMNRVITHSRKKLADPASQHLQDQLERRLIIATSVAKKLNHINDDVKKLPDSAKQKMLNDFNPKVLLIDDMEMTRKVGKSYLSELGFKRIDMAADGVKALQLMYQAFKKNDPYHLVISDWEMPKMSGVELLERVRNDDDLWRTPFFLITGLTDKKYIVEAINKGVSGYITKPINQQIMQSKFEEYLKAPADLLGTDDALGAVDL